MRAESAATISSNRESNRHLGLTLAGLAAGVLWLIVGQFRLSTEVAILNRDRSSLLQEIQSLRALAPTLDQMSEQMTRQMAKINQTMERTGPQVMPPEWERQLAGLEGGINGSAQEPTDATQAQAFVDQVAALVKVLPARVEADYLPRLTPVRWAAMAWVALNRPRSDDALPTIAEEMKELAEAMPENGSAAIKRRLISDARLLSERLEQTNLSEAIRKARAYVENAPGNATDAQGDIENVYDLLGLHEQDGAKAAEVRILRKQLGTAMLLSQGARQVAHLQERWSVVKALRKDQESVFEAAAGMLLQDIASARVALALESIKQPAIDGLEREVRSILLDNAVKAAVREEERQAKALRGYQRWVLEQVKTFEGIFKRTEDTASENWKLYKIGFNQGWMDADYKKVRDAMVAHLLPVNLALSDPPVQEHYQRAFQKGWKQLDGREDQTYVAERTVTVVKRSLREFLEK